MDQIVTAGQLLRQARTARHQSQADLASQLGVDQSVISRIERDSQDPGFAELQRLLAGAGQQLKVSVAAPPSYHHADRFNVFEPNDFDVAKLIPDGLRTRAASLDGETPTGPTASEATYLLWRVQELRRIAAAPERWLHTAYYMRGGERDRGLVHVVLHCGAGSWQAERVLFADIAAVPATPKKRMMRSGSVLEPRVGALAYAHATLAVRAEAEICARTARYCESAARSASACDHAREELEHARQMLATAQQHREDSSYTAELSRKVKECEVDLAQAIETRNAHHFHSGTFDSIGTAGERILTAAYASATVDAWRLYRKMAEHSSMEPWLPTPDEPPSLPQLDGNYTLTDN